VSEANYIAAVLHSGDSKGLRAIDPERDLTGAWLKVYQWIIAFKQEHNRLPRAETVGAQFMVNLAEPPESADVYAAMIQRQAKRTHLEEQLTAEVVPHLEAQDPDKALDATAQAVSRVKQLFPEKDDSRSYLKSLASSVDERWRDYEFRAQAQGDIGLPFPWPTMTRLTMGMQPGEALAIVARPNVGKSWALITIGTFLWQLGYKVLFVSQETPPRSGIAKTERARARLGAYADVPRQRLTQRFDAIAARISAWRFLNGQLNPEELDRYKRYLEICRDPQAAGWGTLRIVSSPLVRNIGHLDQFASEFEPDIILWDSAYLAIERGKHSNNKRTDAAGYFLEDCKLLFERLGVPGVLTWHFNRNVDEDDTHAGQGDISLTDDMPRLFDVIMGLFRTPEMVDAGEAIWRSLKIRDGVNIPELRTRFEIKRHIAFDEISFGITES